MKIEVETLDTCSPDCPFMEIEKENQKFRCIHYFKCVYWAERLEGKTNENIQDNI